MVELMLDLPWPPSVNHYWRNVRGRVLISSEGRRYRETVTGLLHKHREGPLFKERLSVSIVANQPDNRRRDLDNVLKALLDSIGHAGVYKDDSQIDRLSIRRGETGKPGNVIVSIWRATP